MGGALRGHDEAAAGHAARTGCVTQTLGHEPAQCGEPLQKLWGETAF